MHNKLIPMIVTDVDIATVRAFYLDTLGWEVVFDVDGYLQVRHGSDDADPELAFGTLEASAPLGGDPVAFRGGGLVVSVPVADVDAHHHEMVSAGAAPSTEPSDKPWGWRSYLIPDPTGVWLDFCREQAPVDATATSNTAAAPA